MMTANNQLSHSPPNTWLCFTAQGAAGAASSNLALGTSSHSVNAVANFIEDFGSNNSAAGHRRWLLHSAKTSFSYGTTNTTTAIYVFGAAPARAPTCAASQLRLAGPKAASLPQRKFSNSGKDKRARSRGAMCPSCARTFVPRKTEGAGNAGCPLHPQSRVQR